MKLIITNKNGETLDLLNNTDKFVLYKAEGLHGIETSISETESPYMDGTIIENVKALPRGIELAFKITGDVKESIDYFTKTVKSKQIATLTEEEDGKEKTIKGIITIPPYTRMSQSCEITLSLYCGQPYWEDLRQMVEDIASAINLLNFPIQGQYFTANGRPFGALDTTLEKTFKNDGDASVGMIIHLTALDTLKNPRIGCSTGTQNGWYMELNVTLEANDEVEISTVKGNKYITINGISTYNEVPILSYLKFIGNDWLQLETGDNTFNVSASEGIENAYFTISYRRRYE